MNHYSRINKYCKLLFIGFCNLLFLSSALSIAQEGTPSGEYYQQLYLQHWDENTELGTNRTLFAKQTSDGFLWIGSYEGLFRFDGYSFFRYDLEQIPLEKLNNLAFRDLFEADDSTLWFSTQGALVGKKKDKWTLYNEQDGLSGGYINCVAQDINGTLWVGTSNGVSYFDHGKFVQTGIPHQLKSSSIMNLQLGNNGKLWITTDRAGVYAFDGKAYQHFTVEKNKLLNDEVRGLTSVDSGEMWLGTQAGISIATKDGAIKDFSHNNLLFNKEAGALFQDSRGGIWIGTSNGLYVYTNGEIVNIPLPSTTQNVKTITNITEDHEGNFWISTYQSGIYYLSNRKFTNFDAEKGLIGERVYSIIELQNKDILVATGNGISLYHENKFSDHPINGKLPHSAVRDLLEDSKGNLWVCTKKGLVKQSPNGQTLLFTEEEGLPNNYARTALEDKNGVIWVGTPIGIAKIVSDKVVEIIDNEDGLSNDFILSLFEDSRGRILAGTKIGLNIIEGKKITSLLKKDGISNEVIFRIFEDQDQVIWFGSQSGLHRLKGEKVVSFHKKLGNEANIAFNVIEDRKGRFWTYNTFGLFSVEGTLLRQMANGQNVPLEVTHFTEADGLKSSNGTANSRMLQRSNGELWFPTAKGVAVLKHQAIPYNTTPPYAVINQIDVDGKIIPTNDEQVTLTPTDQRISINFTGISFLSGAKVVIQYKLAGFDDNWQDGAHREVSYTNLPPGTYHFLVKAKNNDGIWNETPTSFTIIKNPAWYQNGWVAATAVLLIFLFFYAIYQARLKAIKQKAQLLEETVAERTKEIQTQKEEIEKKNKKIIESINYAQRLQSIMMPQRSDLHTLFEDAFIFFQAKDIVSGDFYWYDQVDQLKIIMAVDCTGHGVPGTMLSIVGLREINRIIHDLHITSPDEILNRLDDFFQKNITGKSMSRESMDLSICVIDENTNTLHFAGAKNPVYIIEHPKNDVPQLTTIKGDKHAIGDELKNNADKKYTLHSFELKHPTKVYLFSDGFVDQFGGPKDRKYLSRRFRMLLQRISTEPMDRQHELIKKEINDWMHFKGEHYEQIDDMLVMGFVV